MNTGDYFHYELMDIKTEPTSRDELILAFVPLIGFISCIYYNGSKTWVSNETKNQVFPTDYLRRFENEPFATEKRIYEEESKKRANAWLDFKEMQNIEIKVRNPYENLKMIIKTSDGKEFTDDFEAGMHQSDLNSERLYKRQIENRSWFRKLFNLEPKY